MRHKKKRYEIMLNTFFRTRREEMPSCCERGQHWPDEDLYLEKLPLDLNQKSNFPQKQSINQEIQN